jgi:hypothetical protein
MGADSVTTEIGHKASRSQENANVKGRSVPAAPIHNRQRKKGAARTNPPLDASGVTEREHCSRQRQSARAQGCVSRWRPRQEGSMDTTTLLIILIVVLILFGGGWYGRGRWF